MKRIIGILMAIMMLTTFAACGGNTSKVSDSSYTDKNNTMSKKSFSEPESVLSKEEMLSVAQPLTRNEIDKSIGNTVYAKSLIGNIYTFRGDIYRVEDEYATVTFHVEGNYETAANVMVGLLYLPIEELIELEAGQVVFFVGQLNNVGTHEEAFGDWGPVKVIDMIFKNVAITRDRLENTGKLHSKNESFGADAWNIMPSNSNIAYVVHFRDDVSAYLGKTITFSYKHVGDGNIDAYIVE